MSIELVVLNVTAGWILAAVLLFITIISVGKDTTATGTWVIPLYKWCSSRHVFKATLLAYSLGLQTTVGVWTALVTDPSEALLSAFGYTSLCLNVLTIMIYLALVWLWRRLEGKWAPALVTATNNSYCTGCGHPVKVGKLMGGYCPVCGADPDMQCDPHRHERFGRTGDPNPEKPRKGGKKKVKRAR